ncbi:hypothetical protein ETD85_02500 [Nonomuraea zeae]|uniref:Uncharacterized protein n=1 Tax=Nonomuraea zeae TaxID=1642303 RepID=A0A5S4H2V6_9ACTN|nr:hypothetical protein ETD85_02500 [Nonomuraea zeae]
MIVTYLILARLPEGGLYAFDADGGAVLPFLAEYGGRLERRLRTPGDQIEAHLITIPDSEVDRKWIPSVWILRRLATVSSSRSSCSSEPGMRGMNAPASQRACGAVLVSEWGRWL